MARPGFVLGESGRKIKIGATVGTEFTDVVA